MLRANVRVFVAMLVTASISVLCWSVFAADAPPAKPVERAQQILGKAVTYLQAQQQTNGSWQRTDREPPAVTALAVRVLAQAPGVGPDSAPVKKAVVYLLSLQKPDGSIHRGMLANYNTAIIVSALAALKDPRSKPPSTRLSPI